MVITGDIVVDDYTLTFANGKSLAIEPYEAGRVGDWSGSGKSVARRCLHGRFVGQSQAA